MKNLAIIFLLIFFSLTVFAQKPKPPKKKSPTPTPVAESTPLDEQQEFQNARTQPSITDRIAALKKFTEDFPESDKKTLALELIVSSRAELGDQKLRLSDNQNGIELFKLAVLEAPTPISDKLFNEIVIQFPTNLFYRGQREAAFETAKLIEEKISGNSNQMLALAAFYLGTEYASEAKRIALKVIESEPSAAAYQTLGLANRINFELEESETAYTKALELSPDSVISKRSLAEMKRAMGKSEEALALYREILEKDPSDVLAQTGYVLSLFNSDKRAEAETEMAKALESNPNNLFLLVGAAYWYAAHNEGAKAIELAEKAVAFEPRYTWAHIALARGLIKEKRPLEAEKTLLLARQYGNFPTLNYEIAVARFNAGFYREAANELRQTFAVEDEKVFVNLGGRVPKEGKSFIQVLSAERRASIFEPVAADDPVTAEKLKSLFKFSEKLDSKEINETEISEAADEFAKGDDSMKLHRSLYVANRLLQKRIALPKVLEMTESAIGKVDSGLNVSSPVSAVLADELYETRMLAAARNEILVVPEISRQTLSKILRGRIEELTGWAFLQQSKPEDAAVRFKRAISILPEKSAWWRSSKWRLGDALESVGKSKEALDVYLESYNTEAPDLSKRIVIESVYQKVHGSTDGLDQLIGAKPVVSGQETAVVIKPSETPTPEPTIVPTPTPTPTFVNTEIPANLPVANEEQKNVLPDEVKPTPTPEAETLKIPENVPTVKSETETKTEEKETETQINPEVTPTPTPQEVTETETKPSPTPEEVKKEEIVPNVSETPKPLVSETPAPTPETTTLNEISTTVNENPEKTSEQKSVENNEKPAENTVAAKTQNPLFEPIVITVPKVERKIKIAETLENKQPETENKEPQPEKKEENPENPDVNSENKKEENPENKTDNPENINSEKKEENPENPPVETKIEEASETKTDQNPAENNPKNYASRPRIVAEVKNETLQQCELKVSQNTLSLINDGGSLGIFLSFEGTGGDLTKITASTSSPRDILIEFQSDIGVSASRALFAVKSISSNVGVYTVTFESNCGKKDVTVTVR